MNYQLSSGIVSRKVLRERAYDLWQADGGPPGRDADYLAAARRSLPQIDALERHTLHYANNNHQGGTGPQPLT